MKRFPVSLLSIAVLTLLGMSAGAPTAFADGEYESAWAAWENDGCGACAGDNYRNSDGVSCAGCVPRNGSLCGDHHGGVLLAGHRAAGHKGPCYWYGASGGRCCGCDSGYMLPVQRAQRYNWNRNYAYTDYGVPTALVVPPTSTLQTNWGWGVASSRISRIDHQFQRNYPGGGPFGGPFRPTPVWPSDTTQFGVYYVRGPW